MNTLTTIKPKRSIQDLQSVLKNAPKQHVPVKKEAKQNKLVYPSKEYTQYVLDTIFNMEFASHLTKQELYSCKMLAKTLTLGVAHHDVVEMAMERVKIEEPQLMARLKSYSIAQPELQNYWKKQAKAYIERRSQESEAMKELFDRQAQHLNNLDDETAELVMDLEDSEVTISVSTNIRTYLAPAKDFDDNKLMTPTQVSEYLITVSKGACIVWPHKIGKELQQRGFKKSDYVNAYYVELVR